MTTARIQCCAITDIRSQPMRVGAVLLISLDMTPQQRLAAVAELLGGMSEQQAFESLQALFPQWFQQPQPEVSESSFGEFMEVSAS